MIAACLQIIASDSVELYVSDAFFLIMLVSKAIP